MKRSLVIFLLISLTAPFYGTYIFLQYNRKQIKKEVKGIILNKPDDIELIQLKFTFEDSQSKLNWKHSREFEYNGQMYDIVCLSQEGDTIIYTCYEDHKETRLNKMIARTASRALSHDPARKSQNEKVVSFMKSFFRQDSFAWKPSFLQPAKVQFSFINFHFSFYLPSPPTPPPELA